MGAVAQYFAQLCRNFFIEWRHRKSGRNFLRRILPIWLFPYTNYLDVSPEDAGYLIIGLVSCLVAMLLRTVLSRPWLRKIFLVGLIFAAQRMIFW